jgi:hypothetical protein
MNIREMLTRAGIPPVENKINLIYSNFGFKGPKDGYEGPHGLTDLSPLQASWLNNKAMNPLEDALYPWRYVSAVNMDKVDVQSTIQTLGSVSGKNPLLAFDLETTGTNIGSPLFHPTEIALARYNGINSMYASTNIAVAPDLDKVRAYRNLMRKASAGLPLTTEERFAIASFGRYSGKYNVLGGYVLAHSPFDMKFASGTDAFTKEQIKSMKRGLRHLMAEGVPATRAFESVGEFFDRHFNDIGGRQVGLFGHNIRSFDIPGIQTLPGGKEKWAQLIERINGGENVIDTLNAARISYGDATGLYRKYLFNRYLGGYKGEVSPELRKNINSRINSRLRKLDLNNSGMLTMDSLRKLTGVNVRGIGAHGGAVDINDNIRIYRKILPALRDSANSAMVDISRSPLSKIGAARNKLRFDTNPMQPDDLYLALQGYKGSGLDFAADIEDTIEGLGGYAYDTVFNNRQVYKFEGFFESKHEGKNVYGAKFSTGGRVSFLTGETPDALRLKLQSGALRYISPEHLDDLPQEVLEDLARQRLKNWSSYSRPGYSTMKRFLAGDLKTVVEKRDYLTMQERLASEMPFLNKFIEQVEGSDLTPREKNIAFARFYRGLDKIAPAAERTVDRSWDPFVGIRGANVSIRTERFNNDLLRIINKQIRPGALQQDVEATQGYVFGEILRELKGQGVITEENIVDINSMKKSFAFRMERLRGILENSKAVLEQSARVRTQSMAARNIADMNVAIQQAEGLINRSIGSAKMISQGLFNTSFEQDIFGNLTGVARDRVLQGVRSVASTYKKRGLGFHIADINNHLRMFVHGGSAETFANIISSLEDGSIPDNVLSFEIPTLSKYGHIIYGGEQRVNAAGRLALDKGGKLATTDVYSQLIEAINRKVGTVKRYLSPAEGKPDIMRARDAITSSVRDVFEKAAGASRATTANSFEEAFRLDIRGNDADLLREYHVDIKPMAKTIEGTEWDNLNAHQKLRFLKTFKDQAQKRFPNDSILKKLTVEGIKEEKVREGYMSLMSERDLISFGAMTSSKRPNMVQWLNSYSYTVEELEGKIAAVEAKFKSRQGIGTLPYVISKAELETYNKYSRGRTASQALAKGVNVGALHLTSQELVDVLSSDKAQNILGKYGLSIDKGMPIERLLGGGTWEQGVLMSPEMRGLLQGRQPKMYEISLDELRSGSSELNKDLAAWMNKYSSKQTNSAFELKRGAHLYTEIVPLARGSKKIKNRFDEDIGRITSFEVDEVNKVLRLHGDVIFEMEDATKIMYDTRKGTTSYFGTKDRLVESSQAMHEIFGKDVHMVYLANEPKHKDFAANIKGQISQIGEALQGDDARMAQFQSRVSELFGDSALVTLPGRRGTTLAIANTSEMIARGITPEKAENAARTLMHEFGVDTSRDISGIKTHRSLVEVRRSLIHEQKHMTPFDRSGGVKMGPREFRALKSKGLILGVDMDPLINYMIAEEGQMADMSMYRGAVKDMYQTIGAIVDPGRSPSKVKTMADFAALPKIANRPWYTREKLKGSILAEKEMFTLKLPVSVQIATGGLGVNGNIMSDISKTIDSVAIGRQALVPDKYGKIHLNDQSKALVKMFDAVRAYESFNVEGIPHGGYDSKDKAFDAIQRTVREYVDVTASELSGSHGMALEHAMSPRLPASGYLKAQNISANLKLSSAVDGTIEIGEDIAKKMFHGADSRIWEDLRKGEFYGLIRRDPNESNWNFQAVRYQINPELEGNVVRMGAIEAAMMEADFDGDQVSLMSPYSKRMNNMIRTAPGEYAQLQATTKRIHEAQSRHNTRLSAGIQRDAMKQSEKRLVDPLDIAKAFEKAAAGDELYGQSYLDQVMQSRLSKGAAGPLYNVVQRYGDVGAAVLEGVARQGHGAIAGQRMELLDLFNYVTTEKITLKGKSNSVMSIEETRELITDLYKGTDLAGWKSYYEGAITDTVALGWSGSERFIKPGEIASDSTMLNIKSALAGEMLGNIQDLVKTSKDSGFDAFFAYNNIAGKMFASEQAFNENTRYLRGMFNQFLSIDPSREEFMSSFVPTEYSRSWARATGQQANFESAQNAFYNMLDANELTKEVVGVVDQPTVVESFADAMSHGGATSKATISDMRSAIDTAADVVDEASLWKKIPKWAKWGIGVGAGLAVTGSMLRKEPSPDPVLGSEQFGETPPAVVQMNDGPQARMSGHRITVRAKNDKNIDLSTIGDAVKNNVGNVNIYQKDDSRAVTREFAQNLFMDALGHGRAPNGTPNSY